jgi:hypothetical protein
MLQRVAELLDPGGAAALAAAGERARALPQQTPEAMADASLAHYDAALDDARASRGRMVAKPLAPARMLAALGYEAWHPPGRADGPVQSADAASSAASFAAAPAHDDAAPTVAPTASTPPAAATEPAAAASTAFAAPQSRGPLARRTAALALRFGNTGPGRVLRRLTPDAILAALKARLF